MSVGAASFRSDGTTGPSSISATGPRLNARSGSIAIDIATECCAGSIYFILSQIKRNSLWSSLEVRGRPGHLRSVDQSFECGKIVSEQLPPSLRRHRGSISQRHGTEGQVRYELLARAFV